VFRAVESMSGDYDRAEVLKSAAAKTRLDSDEKREAFLKACAGVQGDYERGRVLHELIEQPKLSPELARGVLSLVPKMGGDYEAAAEHLGDYSRKRVLSAVNR